MLMNLADLIGRSNVDPHFFNLSKAHMHYSILQMQIFGTKKIVVLLIYIPSNQFRIILSINQECSLAMNYSRNIVSLLDQKSTIRSHRHIIIISRFQNLIYIQLVTSHSSRELFEPSNQEMRTPVSLRQNIPRSFLRMSRS